MEFSLCINSQPKMYFDVVRKREMLGGICEYRWTARMDNSFHPDRIGMVRHNPQLGMVDLAVKVLQAYQVWSR